MTFHRLFDASKAQKLKKCPECGDKYLPGRKVQPTCGKEDCQVTYGLKKIGKEARRLEKIARANYRAARESMKTVRDYVKPAQDAFNAFIRERDKDMPCRVLE